MQLPNDAKMIISLFLQSGYEAYAVGGCVRDSLLKRPFEDVDITTSAEPAEIISVLEKNNIRYIKTGLKHGTITALVNKKPYEITAFRRDGDYKDSRHPESVEFVRSLEEDLRRRDFTVNAMAYNAERGTVDLFGGKDDLENGIIRAVGNPDKRFKEDALRIMRAMRFASVLGFEIEKETHDALLKNAWLLKNVSSERICTELFKLLCGKNALNVLRDYSEVITVVIPELKPAIGCAQNTPWHCYDVYEHIVRAVDFAPNDSILRLAMLLHDIGKPYVKKTDSSGRDHFKTHAPVGAVIAEQVLKRLKVSNKVFNDVTALVRWHQSVADVNGIKIGDWFVLLGPRLTVDLLDARLADLKAHNPEKIADELKKLFLVREKALQMMSEGTPWRVCDLKINGWDLKALGYSGRKLGAMLDEMLLLAANGKIENSRDALLDYAAHKKTQEPSD